MKRNLIVATVVTIAVVIVAAVVAMTYFNNSPAQIILTHSYTWHGTQYVTGGNNTAVDPSYSGNVTWVIFHFNASTTKDTQLNLNDCYLTINGQNPTVLHSDGGPVNLQSGRIDDLSVSFVVEGIYEDNFQLGYNGPADVTIT